ncbi:MAG: hypothetical protein AAGD86_13600, partial [Pseudomonadota bacterium]
MIRRLTILTLALFGWCGSAHSAVFNLFYDASGDGQIVPGAADIVGTGRFSYDGPITEGLFLLSDLSGVSFNVTFVGSAGTAHFGGPPFDPADTGLLGIDVRATGDVEFVLTFVGNSTATQGSLDIVTASGLLTHQPNDIDDPSAGPRLYFAVDTTAGFDAMGDYLATTAAVPVPA